MLEAQTRQLTLGNERLSLRIGIHTGSATAGIIGDRRFSYDVWDDAVYTSGEGRGAAVG